ncbi:MAG: M15 family metallopeptidase [Candidatus Hodarchaeota archaeon]
MGKLNELQFRFAYLVSLLIQYVYAKGYTLTFGDAYATDGHKMYSFHYKRLAIDLNLFKDGSYLAETKDHRFLGEFWESLDPKCTWGGRFSHKDGNHYSYGEGK